jgi:hypothetical protein
MDADLDLRLARYFPMSEGVFLGLQLDHEPLEAKHILDGNLDRIIPRRLTVFQTNRSATSTISAECGNIGINQRLFLKIPTQFIFETCAPELCHF